MKTVTVIFMGKTRNMGGCEIYRATTPLLNLEEKSGKWLSQWFFFDDLYYRCVAQGWEILDDIIKQTDILVMPRAFTHNQESRAAMAQFIRLFKANGVRVVYEVDDDYSNEFRHVVDGDAIELASWCDAITVTTPFLAQRMTRLTGRPSYVLPNMVTPETWKDHSRTVRSVDGIVIGLTGSATHYKDWEVIAEPLKAIVAQHPEVTLVVGGFDPDYLGDIPHEYIPPTQYHIYAEVIRACDIILCPVIPEDGFNDGKSPIKAIEGMAASRLIGKTVGGAAIIATKNRVYSLAIAKKTGLLVEHTPEAWHTAIESLVTNHELRRNFQLNGYQWVWKHHNMAREWTQWEKAYNTILKSPANSLPS